MFKAAKLNVTYGKAYKNLPWKNMIDLKDLQDHIGSLRSLSDFQA